MGLTAENIASEFRISREDQDAFALESHRRALAAIDGGRFKDEIASLPVREVTVEGGHLATLARQYSDGPSAETAGLLGTFRPGELLPGFEEAVAQLQPGEISDVVRTRVGLHIIRLEARQAGTMRPFEEVQEEIKSEILRDKTERKYQEWLESLRQQSYIKILYEG